MTLRDYTDAELRAELARRSAPVCTCGPDRRVIVAEQQGFLPRIGCLTCNIWDDPRAYLSGGRTV